jgi:hypothetical protein
MVNNNGSFLLMMNSYNNIMARKFIYGAPVIWGQLEILDDPSLNPLQHFELRNFTLKL